MINFSSPIAGCMRWGKWGAGFTTVEYLTMINECLHNGITSFDHADIYGDYTTEADFGEALKESPSLREQIQLITKCGIQITTPNRPLHQIKSYNTGKEYIIETTERSLENFHTDYLDVLLIHRPDPLLNPEEVAEAITTLKQQGKILHFGVSNFLPHQVDLLQKFIPVQYNQLEVSILHLPPFVNGMLDHCLQHNIIPMAWAPLGGGLLNDDTHPRYRSIAATASELAAKYLTGINQILIAFLLAHPSGIIPVLGTTKIERLSQVKEASNILLEKEDWFKLYTAALGEEVS
jgi:predicted oxidoreductase